MIYFGRNDCQQKTSQGKIVDLSTSEEQLKKKQFLMV